MVEKANDFIASLYIEGGIYDTLGAKYDKMIGVAFFDPTIGLSYVVNKN